MFSHWRGISQGQCQLWAVHATFVGSFTESPERKNNLPNNNPTGWSQEILGHFSAWLWIFLCPWISYSTRSFSISNLQNGNDSISLTDKEQASA